MFLYDSAVVLMTATGTDIFMAWDHLSHSMFLVALSNSRKQIIIKKNPTGTVESFHLHGVKIIIIINLKCESENLNEEDTLRFQLEAHAMSAVIQEVLQSQELHPA